MGMKTYGERYDPAMEITDQKKADAYFRKLVKRCMSANGISREEAERVERSNLGYYAGYCGNETRARVERLFHCAHPVFGSIAQNGPPSQEAAFEAGLKLGEAMKRSDFP